MFLETEIYLVGDKAQYIRCLLNLDSILTIRPNAKGKTGCFIIQRGVGKLYILKCKVEYTTLAKLLQGSTIRA